MLLEKILCVTAQNSGRKRICSHLYQDYIIRLLTLDALQCAENVVSYDRQMKTYDDVTLASVINDVILGFYLFINRRRHSPYSGVHRE